MKYIIRFKKTDVICYISHLDIVKVFKRAFKRADIRLAYSKGFNPHPKMGFAQPLSLGYEGLDEYIEFETAGEYVPGYSYEIFDKLKKIMPDGLELISIAESPEQKKTLASQVAAADYDISIMLREPLFYTSEKLEEMYLNQSRIMVLKKQKKKPEPVLVDIKQKIRKMTFEPHKDILKIHCKLDAGSDSNLSPELVLDSFAEATGIEFERNEIKISRTKLHFKE